MVALVSDATLNRFNIDTVERAIVFSVLSLQAAIANTPNNQLLREKVFTSIRPQGKNGIYFNIDAYLPFDLAGYTKYGGKIIHSLRTFNTEVIDLNDTLIFEVEPSEVTTPTIEPFPSGLARNIETYFYYYVSILFASLDENRNEIIRIVPQLDSLETSEVRVRIDLPLDPKKWILSPTILGAVKRIATFYEPWDARRSTTGIASTLANELRLINAIRLIN